MDEGETEARQIRAARAALGWTQHELAEKSGITRKTLAAVEAGDLTVFASSKSKMTRCLEEAGITFAQVDGRPAILLPPV